MATISVLMSVYKFEKAANLNQSLHSVWSDQILKPIEIILVEDGSLNKDLYDVIDEWKKVLGNKLVLLMNEANLGLTKSLNKGIEIAKGDYIARMDSDDISNPERFNRQAAFLDQNPDIDVVGGSIQEFNHNNNNIFIRKFPLEASEVRKYICKACPVAHPTVMIRRRVFDAGNRYNEKFRTSQDIALWYELVSKGYKIANIEYITLKFRREDDVFKRRSTKKAKDELIIYLNGIKKLHGIFSWRYIYPLMRYFFRIMPTSLVKTIYGSTLRKKVLNK
ncbi:MAG: glycosyltransferase [Muribaculaceae bacterium]|nr:glycosyltransferase [Muribaculaceae bacterium]